MKLKQAAKKVWEWLKLFVGWIILVILGWLLIGKSK